MNWMMQERLEKGRMKERQTKASKEASKIEREMHWTRFKKY